MKKIATILLFSLSFSSFSQSFKQQQKQVAVYNVATGCIIGAIGSTINRKPNESIKHAFLNGLWKGAVGGAVCYGGKRYATKISTHNNLGHAWGANGIHSIGASILDNAASNRSLFEVMHYNFGFIRVEANLKQNTISKKIMPVAFGSFLYSFNKGTFNFDRTMKTGTVFFDLKGYNPATSTGKGLSAGLCILVPKHDSDFTNSTISHELIHTFQYNEMLAFNNFIDMSSIKLLKKISNKRYVYMDMPHMAAIYISFLTLGYENNPFEKEASIMQRR